MFAFSVPTFLLVVLPLMALAVAIIGPPAVIDEKTGRKVREPFTTKSKILIIACSFIPIVFLHLVSFITGWSVAYA